MKPCEHAASGCNYPEGECAGLCGGTQHINRERSPKRQPAAAVCSPYCIPVTWTTDQAHFLAYHHGWMDARFYNVVEIPLGGPYGLPSYVAAVDDFGDLVPITHRPWVQRGSIELH